MSDERMIPALEMIDAASSLIEAAQHPMIGSASVEALLEAAIERLGIAETQINAAVSVLEDRDTVDGWDEIVWDLLTPDERPQS